MSVLRFESSQGNTVYFLPLKTTSNKLELQQTYVYLIKHLIALQQWLPDDCLVIR